MNQATPTSSSQVVKPWDVIISMMHEPVPGSSSGNGNGGAWGGAGGAVTVGGADECVAGCATPPPPAPRSFPHATHTRLAAYVGVPGLATSLSLAAGAARYLEATSGDYVSSILSKARKQAGRGGE